MTFYSNLNLLLKLVNLPLMEYKLTLLKKEEICRDTYGLYFDISTSDFTYEAGQFVSVTIPDLISLDGKDNRRFYSIANAPGDKYIEIIIRRSGSDFSNYLTNLSVGSQLVFEEARGEIRSSKIQDNTIFIAGGTGITPVRSILKDFDNNSISKKLILFYSNRSAEHAAFIDELKELSKKNNSFKLISIVEDISNVSSDSEKGFFSEEIFRKYVKNPAEHFYYVTGPPMMLSESIKVLIRSGVPEDKIFVENV